MAEMSERRGDVGRCGLGKVLAGKDAGAHEQERDPRVVAVAGTVAGGIGRRRPISPRDDQQVAATTRIVAVRERSLEGAAGAAATRDRLRAEDLRDTFDRSDSAHDVLERVGPCEELVVDSPREVEILLFELSDVWPRAEPPTRGLLGGCDDVIDRNASRVEPLSHTVLGNRHHAMIGRQSDDVAVGPYRPIEMVEQSAQGAIQPDQSILYLVAARTEMGSGPIEGREADREIIRRPTLAKL